jgi:hypothetical protein
VAFARGERVVHKADGRHGVVRSSGRYLAEVLWDGAGDEPARSSLEPVDLLAPEGDHA